MGEHAKVPENRFQKYTKGTDRSFIIKLFNSGKAQDFPVKSLFLHIIFKHLYLCIGKSD